MEKTIKASSGWLMLVVFFLMLFGGIYLLLHGQQIFLAISMLLVNFIFVMPGFIAIEPNSSRVLTLFGAYIGSVKDSGFFHVNPF
jgi:hypothetical protein